MRCCKNSLFYLCCKCLFCYSIKYFVKITCASGICCGETTIIRHRQLQILSIKRKLVSLLKTNKQKGKLCHLNVMNGKKQKKKQKEKQEAMQKNKLKKKQEEKQKKKQEEKQRRSKRRRKR